MVAGDKGVVAWKRKVFGRAVEDVLVATAVEDDEVGVDDHSWVPFVKTWDQV